jgi:hypothetical protein
MKRPLAGGIPLVLTGDQKSGSRAWRYGVRESRLERPLFSHLAYECT